MILDVLALQYLFGKNLNHNIENTSYSLLETNFYMTLWDAAGIDTLNANNATKGWTISLPNIQLSSIVDTKVGFALPTNELVANSPQTLFWLAGDYENVIGSKYDDFIEGNAVSNTLRGGNGSDTLDGGAGVDTLIGGAGNDIYVVDSTTDIITEVSNQGTDTIQSSVTFSLASIANVENITLTGDIAINATGNTLSNTITGNNGNNILNGGAGTDTLVGGLGSDIYVVDSTTDIITEVSDQGDDTIQSSVTFSLASIANVENITLTGTSAINATGNTLSNTITGNNGNNILNGGAGSDTLIGGAGNDIYYVDNANDVIIEIAANNTSSQEYFSMGNNNDVVVASTSYTLTVEASGIEDVMAAGNGTGNTTRNLTAIDLTGNDFTQALIGNDAINTLSGLGGNDYLVGMGGNDTLYGGDGNDVFFGGAGNDYLNGESDDDIFLFNQGSFSGTNLINQTGAVILTGGADVIDGGTGSDTIYMGGSLADYNITRVSETDYAISLKSGVGETAIFRNIDKLAFGGIESDAAIDANLANAINVVTTTASDFDDNLSAPSSANWSVNGLAGNDTITGGRGNDTLNGGEGNDILSGGLGNDTYVVDSASDIIIEASAQGTDTVQSSVTFYLAANVERLTLTGTSAIEGYGNTLNNTITGNSGNNILDGDAGNDTLIGGAGNDLLLGGSGADTLRGGSGDDVLDGGVISAVTTGQYSVDGNTVNYSDSAAGATINLATGIALDGFGGTDTLVNINTVVGSAYADIITGSAGNDKMVFEEINGGAGNDTLDGGAITDTINQIDSNRVSYQNAIGSVTVDLSSGRASGAAGNDVLTNFSSIRGSSFADTLKGSNRTDLTEHFEGGDGNDAIDGRGGLDLVRYDWSSAAVNVNLVTGVASDGFGGTDTLLNIEGVYGSAYNDTLTGGNASNGTSVTDYRNKLEWFRGNGGNDVINGGQGYDRADYTSAKVAVTVNLATGSASDGLGGTDTLISIEGVRGSAYNDTLTGSNALFESFEGREGDDMINGAGGIDRVDYYRAISGVTVNLSTGSASDGYGGTDTLLNIEDVRGSQFADYIIGNGGNNILDGSLGEDLLIGGAGNDIYYVDNASDLIIEESAEGTDTVQSSVTFYLAANVERLTLTGTSAIEGYGNTLNNTITGNSGNNILDGGAGVDTLIGGAGNDTLTGGEGADYFVFNGPSESGLTTTTRDIISDFDKSQGDKIHLQAIDAKTGFTSNDNFSFVNAAPREGAGNGLLWYESGVLYGSIDNDAAAEFTIGVTLTGISASNASDYILL
jgi:Ca2+-binding RTX toxin-like protein